MISLLGKLFGRASANRRLIFKYQAEGLPRFADPMRVLATIKSVEPEWHNLVPMAITTPPDVVNPEMKSMGEKNQAAAVQRLIELSRMAFDLKPFSPDGSGVTDAEAIGTLTTFIDFLGRLAVSASPFPKG